jgi:hypothetical protein
MGRKNNCPAACDRPNSTDIQELKVTQDCGGVFPSNEVRKEQGTCCGTENQDSPPPEVNMDNRVQEFSISVSGTSSRCQVGEKVAERNIAERRIPVLSCEGACIRGEIARLAANLVAKQKGYARACHGEFFSVPASAMSRWVKEAGKVVLIDGCFLRCHGRIIENLVGKDSLRQFDALSVYRKYTDVFDIDDVPEEARRETARQVADSVLSALKRETQNREGRD